MREREEARLERTNDELDDIRQEIDSLESDYHHVDLGTWTKRSVRPMRPKRD